MDKPQEQKFLRAIYHLAGVIFHCALGNESQNTEISLDHYAKAGAHKEEIFKLVNPELTFVPETQQPKPQNEGNH